LTLFSRIWKPVALAEPKLMTPATPNAIAVRRI